MRPYDLTTNRLKKPMAVTEPVRLSWKLQSSRNGERQTAYEITIRTLLPEAAEVWCSGKVESSETLDILLPVKLRPFTTYEWTVRVWNQADEGSEPASPALFETGPMSEQDWSATWISSLSQAEREHAPSAMDPFSNQGPEDIVYFRGVMDIPDRPVAQARLYLASEKACYIHLCGQTTDQWRTAPMTRNMKKRILYLTYDVTDMIRPGKQILGIESQAGNVLAQLVVTYKDGIREIMGTNEAFTFWSGATCLAPMESGEIFDARLEPWGWDQPEWAGETWAPVYPGKCPAPKLEPNCHPTLQVTWRVHPRVCRQLENGNWIFEGDAITVGAFSLRGSAPAGTKITVTMSEQLQPDGSLLHLKNSFIPNASESVATSYYTFRGEGVETFMPKFAFSSFQYIEVAGYPGTLRAEDLWLETIQTPIARTAGFRCSNDLFNILFENMCRTVENDAHDGLGSTYLDEKGTFIGGDASFAGEAILYTEDIVPIFRQEIGVMLDGQTQYGGFREPGQPGGVPGHPNTTPEWDSTALHLTKYLDDYAGLRCDTARHYEALKHYMESELQELRSNGYLEDSNTGGDWNSPEAEFASEDGLISGSACDYHSYEFLCQMARWLDQPQDIPEFQKEMTNIAEAINRNFLKNGYYETSTTEYIPLYGGPMGWKDAPKEKIPVGYRQASNLIPLVYGIAPESEREKIFDGLVADIHAKGNHLDTGCIASKSLLTYLSDHGELELAYDIANQRTFPSWGFWVEHGATTMWEHWRYDSRSRNHFFLGAGIQEWLFKTLGGFREMKEGFRQATIRPAFPEKLNSLHISLDTVRGLYRLDWTRDENGIALELMIPPNVSAQVRLPGRALETLEGGTYSFTI